MRVSPQTRPGDQGGEHQVGEKGLILDIATFCYGKHQIRTKVKTPVSPSPSFAIVISPWPVLFHPSWQMDYFEPDPRYHIISPINMSVSLKDILKQQPPGICPKTSSTTHTKREGAPDLTRHSLLCSWFPELRILSPKAF